MASKTKDLVVKLKTAFDKMSPPLKEFADAVADREKLQEYADEQVAAVRKKEKVLSPTEVAEIKKQLKEKALVCAGKVDAVTPLYADFKKAIDDLDKRLVEKSKTKNPFKKLNVPKAKKALADAKAAFQAHDFKNEAELAEVIKWLLTNGIARYNEIFREFRDVKDDE